MTQELFQYLGINYILTSDYPLTYEQKIGYIQNYIQSNQQNIQSLQTNIAPNPGFETDPCTTGSKWSTITDATGANTFGCARTVTCGTGCSVTFAWATDQKYAGLRSAKILATGVAGTKLSRWITDRSTAIISGKKYDVSAYIKTSGIPAGSRASLAMNYWDANLNIVGSTATVDVSTTIDWTQKTVSLLAPANAKFIRVELRLYGSGTVWFDNISITETAVAPTITVVTPNGAESWTQNTTHAITWTSTGSIANVKIELMKAGIFNRTISSSTPNAGTYSWLVLATQTPGTDYTVKITDVLNTATTDSSAANFTIAVTPALTVTSPNGAESWRAGSTHNITWTSIGSIANVKIDLMKAGVLNKTIIASTPNDGSYPWTIDTTQILGNNYQIRISDVSDSNITDSSNLNFTIAPPAGTGITVVAPNGNENWYAGDTQSITWSYTGNPGDVMIELMRGIASTIITSQTPNDGTFPWNIPPSQTPANDYRIQISSIVDPTISDTSDSDFDISNPCPTPASDYTYSPNTAKPNEIEFTDISTNNPTSWLWNFGDTNTSTLQNPTHTYVVANTYTVKLKATNSCGVGTEKSIDIPVTCPVPASNFTFALSANTTNTIQFTDTSTNTPTSWSWDFGDSTTIDTTQNPKHVYSKSGTYTVELIASNSCGTGTSKTTDITVTITTKTDNGKTIAIVVIVAAGGYLLLSSMKSKQSKQSKLSEMRR